jgi:CheY-like chemotaxis protein
MSTSGDHNNNHSCDKATPRILVVEDHQDTRDLLAMLLKRAGFAVEGAADATSAVRKAETQSFDLVISDLGLPDMPGVELMRKLHAAHGLRGIALTGYGVEELDGGEDAGFVTHLTKPVNVEKLKEAIHSIIPRK